nr:MAG TPA: hypothetical protein [Caudoviricetes sp.]
MIFSSSFLLFHKVNVVCPCRCVNIGTEFHRPWLVLSKKNKHK